MSAGAGAAERDRVRERKVAGAGAGAATMGRSGVVEFGGNERVVAESGISGFKIALFTLGRRTLRVIPF